MNECTTLFRKSWRFLKIQVCNIICHSIKAMEAMEAGAGRHDSRAAAGFEWVGGEDVGQERSREPGARSAANPSPSPKVTLPYSLCTPPFRTKSRDALRRQIVRQIHPWDRYFRSQLSHLLRLWLEFSGLYKSFTTPYSGQFRVTKPQTLQFAIKR